MERLRRMKGGWAYGNKLSMVITINLNSRSVAYIRRKLLKRLIPKNVAFIQIQKVAIFNSDRKKKSISMYLERRFFVARCRLSLFHVELKQHREQ